MIDHKIQFDFYCLPFSVSFSINLDIVHFSNSWVHFPTPHPLSLPRPDSDCPLHSLALWFHSVIHWFLNPGPRTYFPLEYRNCCQHLWWNQPDARFGTPGLLFCLSAPYEDHRISLSSISLIALTYLNL